MVGVGVVDVSMPTSQTTYTESLNEEEVLKQGGGKVDLKENYRIQKFQYFTKSYWNKVDWILHIEDN